MGFTINILIYLYISSTLSLGFVPSISRYSSWDLASLQHRPSNTFCPANGISSSNRRNFQSFYSLDSDNRINRIKSCDIKRLLTRCQAARSALVEGGKIESTLFGGVKFTSPICKCLQQLNIFEPSPIQKAALAPLMSGLSCVLHAETGSGKTLAYLLPLLKRLTSSETPSRQTVQAMIMVPTKELAVQVAADIKALVNIDEIPSSYPRVQLCIDKFSYSLSSLNSTIVIGTPSFLLDLVKRSDSNGISQVNYLVLDEVDRLLGVLGKYASFSAQATKDESIRPAETLLQRIVEIRGKDGTLNEMQVVAASATVGRPLRRELHRIMDPDRNYGDGFPVIRGDQKTSQDNAAETKTATRAVSIPQYITHQAILRSDSEVNYKVSKSPLSDDAISKKVTVIQDLWRKDFKSAKKAIIFVPTNDDAKQVAGMMKFWGMDNVLNLQDVVNAKKTPAQLPSNMKNPLGMVSTSAEEKVDESREIFVVSVPGARGLHIKDVDCVFVLTLPKTMDEYLHMAGRTGRYGNKRLDGMVVSIVDYDELKRLQSWQTPLGIDVAVKMK